jgi:hypothetical protein
MITILSKIEGAPLLVDVSSYHSFVDASQVDCGKPNH